MTLDYLKAIRDKVKQLSQLTVSYNALLHHAAPMDNMPHGKGGVSDPTSSVAMLRLDRRAEMEALRRDIDHRYANIRKWLDDLHDPILEAYVLLHYCDGMSFTEIAAAMGKDLKYVESVRVGVLYPYFRRHSDDTYTD